jgi:hypothetical protein
MDIDFNSMIGGDDNDIGRRRSTVHDRLMSEEQINNAKDRFMDDT